MKKYFVKEIEGILKLCSRDIQVGGEVLHFPDTHPKLRFKVVEDLGEGVSMVEYIEHPEGRFIGNQREWLTCNLFKVIGEISPDALGYVKEGDEFDEPEVDTFGLLQVGKSRVLTRTNLDSKYLVGYLCKIKGPCGHFH